MSKFCICILILINFISTNVFAARQDEFVVEHPKFKHFFGNLIDKLKKIKSKDFHKLLSNNCQNCHKNAIFPSWMYEEGELEKRLFSDNTKEKIEAQEFLKKINKVINLDNSMPPRSDVEKRHEFTKNPDFPHFKAWVAFEVYKLNNISVEGIAKNSIQLLPYEKIKYYRSLLPTLENVEMDRIFKDPNTIFFDRSSLVPGYQDPSLPVNGIRTTEPGFKGASFGAGAENLYLNQQGHLRIFHKGVGLEKSNVKTFHLLYLPKDENGNLMKIKVFGKYIPPDETPVYLWEFPIGTVSGEVVYNLDATGKEQVLEIRTRIKDSSQGAWLPDIYRPYPTAINLIEKLKILIRDNVQLKSEASALVLHLSNRDRLIPISIKRDGFEIGNFDLEGGTDFLPNMSDVMVKELLKTSFKSSLGVEWDSNSKVQAFAATSKQDNGIVPKNGTTGAIRVDRDSCNKCHENSNKPIREFFHENNPFYNLSISAYGNLPGNDTNLRFTIFDQRYFRSFGRNGSKDNRFVRNDFLPILEMQK